jgi:hypothetical protein
MNAANTLFLYNIVFVQVFKAYRNFVKNNVHRDAIMHREPGKLSPYSD